MTACQAKKIIHTNIPKSLNEKFVKSDRSERFIIPKFNLVSIKNKSFFYNSQKILNFLLNHDIQYHKLTTDVFKSRIKNHLLSLQSKSLQGDDAWLPCNHDLFSTIVL